MSRQSLTLPVTSPQNPDDKGNKSSGQRLIERSWGYLRERGIYERLRPDKVRYERGLAVADGAISAKHGSLLSAAGGADKLPHRTLVAALPAELFICNLGRPAQGHCQDRKQA